MGCGGRVRLQAPLLETTTPAQLRELKALTVAMNVADVVQLAFQCGQPGFLKHVAAQILIQLDVGQVSAQSTRCGWVSARSECGVSALFMPVCCHQPSPGPWSSWGCASI
jgi:hypothetical protein